MTDPNKTDKAEAERKLVSLIFAGLAVRARNRCGMRLDDFALLTERHVPHVPADLDEDWAAMGLSPASGRYILAASHLAIKIDLSISELHLVGARDLLTSWVRFDRDDNEGPGQ